MNSETFAESRDYSSDAWILVELLDLRYLF